MDPKTQMRGNLYNQPFKAIHKKKSVQTRQTSQLFPNIRSHNSLEKTNCIRNQVNQTKGKITQMEARLNNLRKIKQKFELQHKHNQTRIQFIHKVKDRVRQDQEYKEKVRQKKHESLIHLKAQVGDFRDTLAKDIKNAEKTLHQQKAEEAQTERKRQKQQDYLVKKLKQIDQQENAKKAEKIKEFHQTSASRIKQFHESRISFSRENYQKKVNMSLREKQKVNQKLERLKSEQQELLSQVKSSQNQMLSSLYNLCTLNPEKSRNRRRGSVFKLSQPSESNYDIDNYQSQTFEN